MNPILRKKLNLLVHLANIDGNFADTERQVLLSFLSTAGIAEVPDPSTHGKFEIGDAAHFPDRADVMYWSLLLIKADGYIHSDEAAFCKALALKLKYNPEVVDYYVSNDLGSRVDFKNNSLIFALTDS